MNGRMEDTRNTLECYQKEHLVERRTLCDMLIWYVLCPRGTFVLDVARQTKQWPTWLPWHCRGDLACVPTPFAIHKVRDGCSSQSRCGLLASVSYKSPADKGAVACEKCIVSSTTPDSPRGLMWEISALHSLPCTPAHARCTDGTALGLFCHPEHPVTSTQASRAGALGKQPVFPTKMTPS